MSGRAPHRRRKNGRGRPRGKALKPPPGPLAGVARKARDAAGPLARVRTSALFGPLRDVRLRIREPGIGREVNTAHVERLNGTLRCRQARLARRTRRISAGSRARAMLQHLLWLWRDVYNWVRPHAAPGGGTPAMAMGLAD